MLSRFCISISNDSFQEHEKESVIEYENIEKTNDYSLWFLCFVIIMDRKRNNNDGNGEGEGEKE